MEIQQKPDYLIFAEGSKSGELSDFPDISRGWGITLEQTQAKPPLEWMNSAFNRIDKNTLYLLQQGVPEWSESVLYPIGAIIKVEGTLYEAKTQNTDLNPTNSPSDWQLVVRFQDATTKQKGIVQLNSAINSDSETTAATPKAVKTAYDLANKAQEAANAANTNANGRVPNTRKVNNKVLSADITLTASDVSALPLSGGTVTGNTNFTGKLQQSGSDVITSANIANYQSGLGINQTWQNVTTERQANVKYTNKTGKPIQVIIEIEFKNGTLTKNEFYVDDTLVSYTYRTANYNNSPPFFVIVPNESTYILKTNLSIEIWNELR